jgi:CTP synthase
MPAFMPIVELSYMDSENIEKEGTDNQSEMDYICVPDGFSKRGVWGKIMMVNHARINRIPALDIFMKTSYARKRDL